VFDVFDDVSLTLYGDLDLDRTRARRMQRQCDVDMSGCVRYCVKNRDDIGEVAFPFMVLHGYKCGHEAPSFVGRLKGDSTLMR